MASVRRQQSVRVQTIVVGNGWQPEGLAAEVHTVALAANVGVGARNAGLAVAEGELLFFLDDDAWFEADDTLSRLWQLFEQHPRIGMVQTRLIDPATPDAPRYWVPRLRKGDAARSSTCMYVLEAALAIRTQLFADIGGFVADFGYAHEGIDLTWRVWDAGYLVWYAGNITTCHPAIFADRHAEYHQFNGRNRVRLAKRNLPWPVAVGYLGSWSAVELLRMRNDAEARKAWLAGVREGWHESGKRQPIAWGTIWQMTKHGRPPLV